MSSVHELIVASRNYTWVLGGIGGTDYRERVLCTDQQIPWCRHWPDSGQAEPESTVHGQKAVQFYYVVVTVPAVSTPGSSLCHALCMDHRMVL